jgi:aspartate 1-decarboxylase
MSSTKHLCQTLTTTIQPHGTVPLRLRERSRLRYDTAHRTTARECTTVRVELLKSKIHRARITGKNVEYEGSLTMDPELMEAAGIHSYEKVQVVNVHNGSRLETYAIPGQPGSGDVILNGAAARWGEIGDPVIILAYAHVEDRELTSFQPKIVWVDERNRPRLKEPSFPR